ncbi:uncharacterized protein DEA37_0000526, partial [Paragonimus westermani]
RRPPPRSSNLRKTFRLLAIVVKYRDTKHAQHKVILHSTSLWKSLARIVRTKDKSLDLCVKSERLAVMTETDLYPLLLTNATLDASQGVKWFPTVNLASGWWQAEIFIEDRQEVALAIRSRLCEFETMLFGLAKAPATI